MEKKIDFTDEELALIKKALYLSEAKRVNKLEEFPEQRHEATKESFEKLMTRIKAEQNQCDIS